MLTLYIKFNCGSTLCKNVEKEKERKENKEANNYNNKKPKSQSII